MDDEAVGADGEGENSRKQRICGAKRDGGNKFANFAPIIIGGKMI